MAKKSSANVTETNTKSEYQKLSFFVTIVDGGVSNAVISLMNSIGVSCQFVQMGQGTARKDILDILGIEDNKKEVVISLVSSDKVPQIKQELEAFFKANRRNKGVAFSVSMSSLIGLKAYHFIANDL